MNYLFFLIHRNKVVQSGADLGADGGGGGGLDDALIQRLDSLPTQRVTPCTILRYQMLVTDPKNFLNILNLRGERAPKKTKFFGQKFTSKKCLKTLFRPSIFS